MRIVSEYLEPLARFRREQIKDTVVFFGSARFRGRDEADHALELLDNTGSTRPGPAGGTAGQGAGDCRGPGHRPAAQARRGGGGDGALLRRRAPAWRSC